MATEACPSCGHSTKVYADQGKRSHYTGCTIGAVPVLATLAASIRAKQLSARRDAEDAANAEPIRMLGAAGAGGRTVAYGDIADLLDHIIAHPLDWEDP